MEEKYKKFAEKPTLGMLQKWLINNKWIQVPLLDGISNRIINNDSDNKPTSKEWMQFFIPQKYLQRDSSFYMLWGDWADDCMVGQVSPNENQSLQVCQEWLEEFKKQIRENIDNYRSDFSEALEYVLEDSDKESRRRAQQKGMHKYREAELEKIFSDTVFCKEISRYFTTYESEADRIAILVIMALLKLVCRAAKPDGHSSYNFDMSKDGNQFRIEIFIEDPAVLKDKTSDKRHEKNVEDFSQLSNERSDDDDLRFGKNRDGEYNNLKNPDGLYTKDR